MPWKEIQSPSPRALAAVIRLEMPSLVQQRSLSERRGTGCEARRGHSSRNSLTAFLLLVLPTIICTLLPSTIGVADDDKVHAYFAGRIWPGGGQAIEDGVLVVQGSKILAIGASSDIDVPTGARRHRMNDSVLIPGLVIAETSLAENGRDDVHALTPHVRAVDGFDFFGDYRSFLSGGVTTVQVAPGGRRLMPGQGAVVKLSGNGPEDQTLVHQESLRVILSSVALNPPTVYEPPVGAVSVDRPLQTTSPQLATSLASAVSGLRAIFTAARELDAEDNSVEAGELLKAVAWFQHDPRVVRITAQSAAEIRAAIQLAREFELNTVLVDPLGLRPFFDRVDWSSKDVRGIVLNAMVRPGRVTNRSVPDSRGPRPLTPWERASRLVAKGAADKIALVPADDDDLSDILFLAGLFRRGGLTVEQVLNMLTNNPARVLGVGDRVGSLSAGKDADFVVLSQDPFQSGTRVLATYVGGRNVYDRHRNGETTVVQAGAIYSGGELHESSSVVIVGSKISGLGKDVSSPLEADVRKFPEGVVVPGFIDLATGLGLGGTMSSSLPLQTKLGERLFPGDPRVEFARQGGVTTALLSGTGSAPSPVLAFKLGDHPRAIKDPVAIRFAIRSNLTSAEASLRRTLAAGKRYADSWDKYDKDYAEYQKKLKEYEAAKAKYDAAVKASEAAKKKKEEEAKKKADQKPRQSNSGSGDAKKETETGKDSKSGSSAKPSADKKPSAADADSKLQPPKKPEEPKKPRQSASSEPYRELFAGKIPAFVEARSSKAVELALKLFREEFKVELILIGGDDARLSAKSLAEKRVAAAVGPLLVNQVEGKLVNTPQVYANYQVPFGFLSQATTGVRELPLAVQYAVHQGLGCGDALAGLTHMPAKFLKLDNIGTLEPGHDADLVVLNGPPFDLASQVIAVMIDGQWVFERESKE